MIRIDDYNSEQVAADSEALGNFPPGFLPRETGVGELEGVPVFSEQIELLPESQWLDAAKETFSRGGFVGQRVQFDPAALYQGRLPLCWAYSLSQAIMGARATMGLPFELLAPEAMIDATGGRVQGYYCDKALQYAMGHGMPTREYMPQHETNRRNWKDGYRGNAMEHRPQEGFDGGARDMWAETVCALLSGYGCYVGYNWWRHAVWLDALVVDGQRIGVHTPNSHGPGNDATLFGSKAIPSEMFVIRSATFSAGGL